jgi:hypothetical protein
VPFKNNLPNKFFFAAERRPKSERKKTPEAPTLPRRSGLRGETFGKLGHFVARAELKLETKPENPYIARILKDLLYRGHETIVKPIICACRLQKNGFDTLAFSCAPRYACLGATMQGK